jgi:hypothetical protein
MAEARFTEQIIALVDVPTKNRITRIASSVKVSNAVVIRNALAFGLPQTERAAQKGRLADV